MFTALMPLLNVFLIATQHTLSHPSEFLVLPWRVFLASINVVLVESWMQETMPQQDVLIWLSSVLLAIKLGKIRDQSVGIELPLVKHKYGKASTND